MSAPESRRLVAAIARNDDFHDDPLIKAYVSALRHRHDGAVVAIILYGSYLRGQRDTLPDFYVIVDHYRPALSNIWHAALNRLLPPNVYQIRDSQSDTAAKYAVVRLDRFSHAMRCDFHSYFWARFAQPCRLVYVNDETTAAVIIDALLAAVARFIRQTTVLLPDEFNVRALWTTGLTRTYSCELRTETGNRSVQLFESHINYYTELTDAMMRERFADYRVPSPGCYQAAHESALRRRTSLRWFVRRWQGKLLSIARLLKAALTFNDGLDYVLWKIRRHSGVYIEPTARQRRYPLIFAWGLLWRIYRRGGFR